MSFLIGQTSLSLCINDSVMLCCYEKSEYEKRRHDFRDGSMSKKKC